MELSSPISDITRLNEAQKKALNKLGIKTARDLLYHFPVKYGDAARVSFIENVKAGDQVTIFGTLTKPKTKKSFRGGVPMAQATVKDDTGSISATWFNQPYIVKMIKEDGLVRVDGTVTQKKSGELTLTNPRIEGVSKIPNAIGESLFGEEADHNRMYPVYNESKGLTSEWVYHTLQRVFRSDLFPKLVDPIPKEILERYNLPSLATALIWIHTPKKESDAEAARKRFAFEEIFFIQLQKQKQRKETESLPSFKIQPDKKDVSSFTSRFPFELTDAQEKSISDILSDIKKGHPMSRLIEGDVGSGKTAIAASIVYAVTMTRPDPKFDFGNLQTAYMAPTEILAKQQFASFIQYFEHTGVQIALITGSGAYKFPSKVDPRKATPISKPQLKKWIQNGEIPIIVGTHSLIQKSVEFKNLALVVIDEQHRFGTVQRQRLARKDNFAPHLLSMTATPIPRTLALTIYGDLDLSVIDTMPKGRKPVITEIVLPAKRDDIYEHIRSEIKDGRQAYVICPRIDEPDPTKEKALLAKSVTAEAKHLREKIFPEFEIGVMHGKLTPKEKEDIMKEFEAGSIDILVSTSVVEVGVNVPNATLMIIEGAERYGLAQLHQLRGRVVRSSHQAYCYAFTETKAEKSIQRLKALATAKNGFELAEHDLSLRGSGELSGARQWGISDLGMEAIKNIKMVEVARTEAASLVEADPLFKKHPQIKEKLKHFKEIHFE